MMDTGRSVRSSREAGKSTSIASEYTLTEATELLSAPVPTPRDGHAGRGTVRVSRDDSPDVEG